MREGEARALEMLELVRIPSARRRLKNYPHEMSGGTWQRAMIALALACRPKLLLADEPTTPLNAKVQIQILLLLRELQKELGLGVIFVTHNIGVAVEVFDRIAVMYAGSFVETGDRSSIINDAQHPNSKGLLAANLAGAVPGTTLESIPGEPSALHEPPVGCSFPQRCARATPACADPTIRLWQDGQDSWARCVAAVADAEEQPRQAARA